VASFAHEYLLIDVLREKLKDPVKMGSIKAHIAGVLFGYSSFFQNIVFAFLFYLGAVFIKEDGGENEDVFIAIFSIMFAAFGAAQAQQFGPSAGKAAKAAMRIFSIIDEESEICIDQHHENDVVAAEKSFQGEIEFQNVWFRYPTRKETWILKDFSLKISHNEAVALVGESGSGKSTIIQLLYRFYEPHFGEIFIDRVNIKHYNLVSLRKMLGLVQQEPTLFNESIQYNICYGEDVDDVDKAIDAAEISNATGFIGQLGEEQNQSHILDEREENEGVSYQKETLAQGLQSTCGTKGGRLSGGQKQRVAIARAVIRQPQILLLDEATSALDEISQQRVQTALEKVMEGRTSITIAHRLTTIEKADRVVVLKEGVIAAEGSLDEVRDAM
jgi:ATP-binding cassette subfamily B (MDR/TAP) protein 1